MDVNNARQCFSCNHTEDVPAYEGVSSRYAGRTWRFCALRQAKAMPSISLFTGVGGLELGVHPWKPQREIVAQCRRHDSD